MNERGGVMRMRTDEVAASATPGRAGASAARRLAAALMVATLAGCATGPRMLETDVTSYDAWSTLPADHSYAFGRTLQYQNSLELRSYENIVADELALKGFQRATEGAGALVVTLRPSVTTTRVRMRSGWTMDPFLAPYGFYGRRGFGGFGAFGGYGGFGGVGYDPYWSAFDFGADAMDLYQRRLELDIDSRTEVGKRYYEGRVESSGDSDSLPDVMPSMIRALFTDFPGNNGQTRRVTVPLEPRAVTEETH